MQIAISPCPNDTFLFHAWIEGLVGKDIPPEPFFADIQLLNEWAISQRFPIIKLSFSTFAKVSEYYQLLPVGAALGFHQGPKLIAKHFFPIDELKNKRVAIPGKETTAHLLFNHFFPSPKEKCFCLYHEIESFMQNNQADCGLIIHESRFTFEQKGFVEIADLGALWHHQTHSPLPLGGIAIARSLPEDVKKRVTSILRESLQCAHRHPDKSRSFIEHHAQEKNPAVIDKHIATYVNSETFSLSLEGKRAIELLLSKTCPLPHDWLYSTKHV